MHTSSCIGLSPARKASGIWTPFQGSCHAMKFDPRECEERGKGDEGSLNGVVVQRLADLD